MNSGEPDLLDSVLCIDLLEAHPPFFSKVERILVQIESRGEALMTVAFTFGEILTGPRRTGAIKAADAVRAYFDRRPRGASVLRQTNGRSLQHSRSSLKVSQADGIHLASAAVALAHAFVTNDRKLWAMRVPGIKFMVDLDGKVF